MSDDKREKPVVIETKHDPATPAADRAPGETAKLSNDVSARDSFGAPKGDPEWTREAITTHTVKPGFGGPVDKVAKEQAKEFKA